jgi:hypothetical protein
MSDETRIGAFKIALSAGFLLAIGFVFCRTSPSLR